MGDTVEDLINLIICDIFFTLSEKIRPNINMIKSAKLFSGALIHSNYSETDLTIIDIISKYLIFIFGLNQKDAFNHVFVLFTDEKLCKNNIELISFLRNNEINLVTLQ